MDDFCMYVAWCAEMLSRSGHSENSYDIAQIITTCISAGELSFMDQNLSWACKAFLRAAFTPDTCFKHSCAPRRTRLGWWFWEEAVNQYFQVGHSAFKSYSRCSTFTQLRGTATAIYVGWSSSAAALGGLHVMCVCAVKSANTVHSSFSENPALYMCISQHLCEKSDLVQLD